MKRPPLDTHVRGFQCRRYWSRVLGVVLEICLALLCLNLSVYSFVEKTVPKLV